MMPVRFDKTNGRLMCHGRVAIAAETEQEREHLQNVANAITNAGFCAEVRHWPDGQPQTMDEPPKMLLVVELPELCVLWLKPAPGGDDE